MQVWNQNSRGWGIVVAAAIAVAALSQNVIADAPPCGESAGPDVIVGDLPNVSNFTSVGDIDAFSVGTTSCNIGTQTLLWQSSNPNHPVIAQNMYRLKDGRFEQIGLSWLKHGFLALAGNVCGCGCQNPGTGALLGIGCSDPYDSSLNGQQGSGGTGGLGPRFQVNAHTGAFIWTYMFQGVTGNSIYKRLQVHKDDLNPALNAGALYYIEGHYVTPDDAAADNQNNNASHRRINISGSGEYSASLTGSTVRCDPAIRAWKVNVPDVLETDVQVPNEGLVVVASDAWDLGGGQWHYEYAVYNMNCDRSIRSLSVPTVEGTTITNIGFHDVFYHSGDGHNSTVATPVTYDGTDWPGSAGASAVTWSTSTFASNPNANAIRWGTMYNFRFDADIAPGVLPGTATLGLFKPGGMGDPNSVTAEIVVPGEQSPIALTMDSTVPTIVDQCQPVNIDVTVHEGTENTVPESATLHYRFDGGAFLTEPLADQGGQQYTGQVPGGVCGDNPEFYVSVMGDGGASSTAPLDAPAGLFSYALGTTELGVLLEEDFEGGALPAGWSATGLWNVTDACDVNPVCDGSFWAYYGQTGTCNYVTGGSANSGTLSAPAISIPAIGTTTLMYCYNFDKESDAGFDNGFVTVNGTPIDQAVESATWDTNVVDLTGFAGQTVTIAWSFDTIDNQFNNFRGWQIDDVLIMGQDTTCDASVSTLKGDMNGDDDVDGRDAQKFVTAVINESTAAEDVCPGDFTGNGVVEFGDVAGMVDALLNP